MKPGDTWAYPSGAYAPDGRSLHEATNPGMTIRDVFAAAVIGGMASSRPWPREGDEREIAIRAYRLADAMLAARER